MRWGLRSWVGSTITLGLIALFLTGCPKRPEVVETVPGPISPQGQVGMPSPPPAPQGATSAEKSPTEVTAQPSEAALTPGPGPIQEAKIAETAVAASTLKDIYFDYDQSAVRDDSKKLLNENVDWLRKNSAAKVTIEGHCDERGSSEYNLALGERRARATRDYLVAAGIDAKRIGTISFGKERPFAPGHDESAWQQNRRAHFISETR